ncbi:MAG TPA: DNA-binding protein WhiA [Clostridiaceae bacterium]|nr:DNA-binding protein WhiA [Clostridiaceae bacterium]
MSVTFSKRLRASLVENSGADLVADNAPAIIGLVLALAGRREGDKIVFVSEQAEFLDYLERAASLARLPGLKRKAFVTREKLEFSIDELGESFMTALTRGDFVSAGTSVSASEAKARGNILPGAALSRKHFLLHSFLACGSIADPNLQFSLEWQLPRERETILFNNRLRSFGFEPGRTFRRSVHVLYIKKAEKIADFLIMSGANEMLLEYVNIRVQHDISASVNRLMNCDEANTNRQVDTATRQLASIRYIATTTGLGGLPENLRLAAEKRLELPELSIKELGEQMNPPIGKSGMNHRLRKLEEIARELGHDSDPE